jgi:hypothetical protein
MTGKKKKDARKRAETKKCKEKKIDLRPVLFRVDQTSMAPSLSLSLHMQTKKEGKLFANDAIRTRAGYPMQLRQYFRSQNM